MKKISILLLCIGVLYSIDCSAQVSFVKGYYINNSDQKIEGLIKNSDWKNNPEGFEYKKTAQSKPETLTIESVKEFGINNLSKYIRFDVAIDRSSNSLRLLSKNKNPIFKKEKLFLKVLVEGEASLFIYKHKNLTRYFYQTNQHEVEQLIYKQFKTPDNKVGTNYEFRRQLYNHLKCGSISIKDLKHINYQKNALIKFFSKYNSCTNTKFINFDEKATSDLFNLTIRPGVTSSSLSLGNGAVSSRNKDYGSALSARIGLEFEFILGFNKNKWAILFEPTYQYFKAEQKASTHLNNTHADYKSIELPIGLRHYLFLNNNSKVFVNAAAVYDLPINSKVKNLDVSSGVNLAMGIGYKYQNRYSVEFRYQTSRDILNDYNALTSDYKSMSIVFGYTLF